MELESIIQVLLTKLEYVSLPGLGSFVKQYESASLSDDGNSFNPPREFFTFDVSRTFNDEALENYLCEASGLTHGDALEQVTLFVQRVKNEISDGKPFIFPGIGSLSKKSTGEIALEFSDNQISSDTFGLSHIDVKHPVAPKKGITPSTTSKGATAAKPSKPVERPVSAPVEKPKTVTQSTSKSNAFVAIIIIVAMVAVGATVWFIPELHFWNTLSEKSGEPLVSANNNQTIAVADSLANDTLNLNADTVAVQQTSPVVTENQEQVQAEQKVEVLTDKKAALYYTEPQKEEDKTFYIIAGSFTQQNNAQKLIDELSAKGYKPMIVQNNNMYRVALYKFTNRDRAIRELERLKSQNVIDKVWLLSI